jgi:PhnB protein
MASYDVLEAQPATSSATRRKMRGRISVSGLGSRRLHAERDEIEKRTIERSFVCTTGGSDGGKDVRMHTYVNFAGKCAEAFRFYEQHLGGTIQMMMTHGQAPDQSGVKPEWKDAILHASMSIAGTELSGADIPTAQPMRSAYLTLDVDSDAEAERIFSALSGGGEVFMPMKESFFASRFAQLRDRFGINWVVIHRRPMA